MHIVLVESDQPSTRHRLGDVYRVLFEEHWVTSFSDVQKAVEYLERSGPTVNLTIVSYEESSLAMIKALISVLGSSLCLILSDKLKAMKADAQFKTQKRVRLSSRADGILQLPDLMRELNEEVAGSSTQKETADMVPIALSTLRREPKFPADLYVRLSTQKYCKIFRKGDPCEEADLKRLESERKIHNLFVTAKDAHLLVSLPDTKLTQILKEETIEEEPARKAVTEALEVMQNVVTRTGFTPAVQTLAKKAVEVTLHLIGKKPKLAVIVDRLKAGEGQYISSHSLMLAEIACAVSAQVGWSSASTFFKLTMSAFMHDITLKDEGLAKMRTIPEAELLFGRQTAQEYKLHPAAAADYVRQFSEIPPDVDTIVVQHHETPNGSGFPRGLFAKQLSPLSSLFIISHDLLNTLLEKGDSITIPEYVLSKSEDFKTGSFRKLLKSLVTGIPITQD
jgi:HD-GYP domain-containing protein (c-di-GMP phosphodiesterase class II)